jgi:NADH:ubiquinone oxidoreductase subunit K
VAAAEVSVGLALILWMYSWNRTLDVDCASKMRG